MNLFYVLKDQKAAGNNKMFEKVKNFFKDPLLQLKIKCKTCSKIVEKTINFFEIITFAYDQ